MVGSRSFVASFIALATAVLFVSTASAQQSIIANDNVGEMVNGTTASAELEYGEGYGAVFDIPEAWIPAGGIEILGLRVLMFNGPSGATRYCARYQFDIHIESAAQPQPTGCFAGLTLREKEPGTLIYGMTSDPQLSNIGFEVEGNPTSGQANFQDLLFDTINKDPSLNVTINPVLTTDSRVRVTLYAVDNQCGMNGQKPPILASDMGGTSGLGRNFVYGTFVDTTGILGNCGPYHFAWDDFAPLFTGSTPGDWVMRLIVRYDDGSTGMIDMGGGGADAGMDMGGGTDAEAMDMASSEDFGMTGLDSGGGEEDMSTGGEDSGSTGNNTTGGLGIMSISPDSGVNTESTDVVILGSGFQAGAEVLIGADNIGVTNTESGRIRATVPEGFTPGVYDVIVSNPGGDSVILSDGFEVTEPTTDGGGNSASGADGGCGCAAGGDSVPAAFLVVLAGLFLARLRSRR